MTPYMFVALVVAIVFAGVVMIVLVSGHYSYKTKKLQQEQKGISREELLEIEEIANKLDKLSRRIEALETLSVERDTKRK
ncbi:MAG: phage shock protein B [Opitutales bacterium]|nr:phage shock protein B [Opitutales bacterium]